LKALVLAAAIAAAPMEDAPLRRTEVRKREKGGRAERNRFTPQDLEEMFGSMEPTPPPEPPLVIPEPDFIRWEPVSVPYTSPTADGEPLAA
jgi:hypothetical protein